MPSDLSSEDALERPCILVVDDDADVRQAATLLLLRHGYRVLEAPGAQEARSRLSQGSADLVLLDLNLTRGETSGGEGLTLLGDILARDAQTAVVVVTAHSGVNIAVKAMQAGAVDFITKPWSNARLLATLELALEGRRRRNGEAAGVFEDSVLLGESATVERVRERVRRVAPSEAAVLIAGGPGSGKSLLAREIHRRSARAPGPFVVVDLAAQSRDEVEAALFGDGGSDRPGALAEAKGGTLVLDEIGALARSTQARLLLSLQAGATASASAIRPLPVDIRPISLSRRPVETLVNLNHDLLDRLATVRILAPGLCGAVEDIRALSAHFLRAAAQRHGRPERPLSDAAAEWIAAAAWPDGVRGLRQTLERAVVLAVGRVIEREDLIAPGEDAPAFAAPRLAESEKAVVAGALKRNGFNVSRAAAELGLTRPALYRRMAKHGL